MEDPDRPLRILYVDDEPTNLRLLQAVVQMVLKRPDEVLTTVSPDIALELLESGPFDAVVSDQRMPRVSGTQLLATVRERQPDATRVLLTGHAEDREVRLALETGLAHLLLEKTQSPRDMYAAILRAIAARPRG